MDAFIPWIKEQADWLIEILLIGVGFLFLHVLSRFVFSSLKGHVFRRHWQRSLIHGLKAPWFFVLWVFGGFLIAEVTLQNLGMESVFDLVFKMHSLFIILVFTWVFLRWIYDLRKRLLYHHEHPVELSKVDLLTKIGILLIWIVAILSTLQIFGFDLQMLATIGGISGFSLGFAAKDVISNFFGGVMIYATHPFAVGDVVKSPDRAIEGTVQDISWYYTIIEGPDKQPLYVPNSLFSTIVIINHSRKSHWVIEERFMVRHTDLAKIETFVDEIKLFLVKHPQVDPDQNLLVHLDRLADHGAELFVRVATTVTQKTAAMALKQEFLLSISKILETQGVRLASSNVRVQLIKQQKMLKRQDLDTRGPRIEA